MVAQRRTMVPVLRAPNPLCREPVRQSVTWFREATAGLRAFMPP